MAARQPLLTFLPLVCSLISLILILLILLAGTSNTLSNLYYLKVRLPWPSLIYFGYLLQD